MVQLVKPSVNHIYILCVVYYEWMCCTYRSSVCLILGSALLAFAVICVPVFKVSLCLSQCFPTPHILCCEEASSFVLKCVSASWSGSLIAEVLNGWFVLTQAFSTLGCFCPNSDLFFFVNKSSPSFLITFAVPQILKNKSQTNVLVTWLNSWLLSVISQELQCS